MLNGADVPRAAVKRPRGDDAAASASAIEPLRDAASLDVSGRSDLCSDDCAALAEALATSVSLRSLNTKHVSIGPDGGLALAAALAVNSSLTELNCERNGLGTRGGKALGAALSSNTSLTSLNFSLNDIGPDGARAFGDALMVNRSLSSLVCVRSGLGPEGGRAFAKALAQNDSLVSLDLTGNDLGIEGGKAFGDMLSTNTSLTDLNMRWNRIGFGLAGAEAFAAALTRNSTLLTLDVYQNELCDAGAAAFGEAVACNSSLTSLDLGRNEIGPDGARSIGDALTRNRSLTSLSIASNELGAAGGVALASALATNTTLTSLDANYNGFGAEGGSALGQALALNSSLTLLRLERNALGPQGGEAIARALAVHPALRSVELARNGIASGGESFAKAIEANRALERLGLRDNDLGAEEGRALGEALAAHPSLSSVDLSGNDITDISIGCQLALALNAKLTLDLCNNPLSSPPLGRRANAEGLREYLLLLHSESTAVTRVRLMVLGFGGVGKSTFCSAATQPPSELGGFHGSLLPLQAWDGAMIGAWARSLGTEWSSAAAGVLEAHKVDGSMLPSLVVREASDYAPSAALETMAAPSMAPLQRKKLARALGSLLLKGYLSTVGAVNVDGTLELSAAGGGDARRECSLVDFAGQMEYLVSHQLLLASMHTLCMVIQPAASFGDPGHRHHGSWAYWVRFLRALGDRRTGSLLLAVSQLDKVAEVDSDAADQAALDEFAGVRQSVGGGLGEGPVRLEYRSRLAEASMAEVRRRLSVAAEAVAADWWVPASYERLAELVRRIGRGKKAARELPILSLPQLRLELAAEVEREAEQEAAGGGLVRMRDDPLLLKRGVEYLEAVGDVMTDDRLDCLLLDPVSWFASFLAHFIRDDGNPPAEVKRGVVSLDDVVSALRHEYDRPETQVPEVMSLVCKLELCVPHESLCPPPHDGADAPAPAYLFPCLLPAASAEEIARHWPAAGGCTADVAARLVYRGHRFRASAGFLPPGLFPGLLARLRRLPEGAVQASRMWSNAAVLVFGEARLLLRLDSASATLDLAAAGRSGEELFVGAAKGQASVVVWLAHLIRQFVRSYAQLGFTEAWLCSSAACHGVCDAAAAARGGVADTYAVYAGVEFGLEVSGRRRSEHVCEAEGCWHQLGTGHKLEPTWLRDGEHRTCGRCRQEACFALRSPV